MLLVSGNGTLSTYIPRDVTVFGHRTRLPMAILEIETNIKTRVEWLFIDYLSSEGGRWEMGADYLLWKYIVVVCTMT